MRFLQKISNSIYLKAVAVLDWNKGSFIKSEFFTGIKWEEQSYSIQCELFLFLVQTAKIIEAKIRGSYEYEH